MLGLRGVVSLIPAEVRETQGLGEIIEELIVPIVVLMDKNLIFIHDNALTHTARNVTNFLQQPGIRTLI